MVKVHKSPETLSAEIMSACPVEFPSTSPMFFTKEEKTRFTNFVQTYFAGSDFSARAVFEDNGDGTVRVVRVETDIMVVPEGSVQSTVKANFSPVVIHYWLGKREKDDEGKRTLDIIGEFHKVFINALALYPVAEIPYTLKEYEMQRLHDYATAYFESHGLRSAIGFKTGPDTGGGATIIEVNISVFDSQKTPASLMLTAASVRAWLNEQLVVDAVNHRPAHNVERNCVPVEVKVLDEELYWGKEFAPRGSEDAAGIDLMAAVTEDTFLEPGETKLIPTGLAFFLKNPNYVGLIHPRSGLGHKHGIVLGNLTGVIDADYNGQLMVSLWNRNTTGEAYKISRGDRIAQYLIQPVVMGLFKQVNEFSTETARGAGGFGASGLGQQVMAHAHADHHSNVKKMPVQLGELPDAVKDKTFGERMNETRPRVFKKEGVFTKEEMAANTSTIMDNLQAVIDAHQGVDYVAEELSEEQLERVIKWALEYIDGCGGDSTIVKVVVERTQDWNHEAGQLFNRRANMNLFYNSTQFVRIPHPACTFILKHYVSD